MVQPYQPMPQPKKGMPVWAWLAIGCVGILVICGIAFMGVAWWGVHKVKSVAQDFKEHPETAWVKMLSYTNPDVEVVSSDDATGKVTLKNKKTGEVVTLDMADVKAGKISFESSKSGKASFSVDQQSGQVKMQTTDANGGTSNTTASFGGGAKVPDWVPSYPGAASQGVYSAEDDKQAGGTFGLETSDAPEKVLAYFKSQLQGNGYKVTTTQFPTGGMVQGESSDSKRTVTFTLSSEGGKTKVAGAYTEKKGS